MLVASALSVLPLRAHAQSSDPAAAETLFEAGRAAFERKDYDEACAKFAESHRLDPAAGTLINLAACNEERGKLASAWENWREALSLLRVDDERRPGVEKRKLELDARLPRLEVRLAPGAPSGSDVSRDGVTLGPAALGLPLPVDPGPHRVEVRALGRSPRSYEVVAEEGRLVELVVDVGPVLSGAQATSTAKAPPPPRPDSSSDSRRTTGYTVGGIGLLGLGIGAVTGLVALDRKNTIEETCEKKDDRYACPSEGADAAKSGKTLATVSTIATISGLALTATGLVLVLTSPNEGPAVTATWLPGGAMLGGRGTF